MITETKTTDYGHCCDCGEKLNQYGACPNSSPYDRQTFAIPINCHISVPLLPELREAYHSFSENDEHGLFVRHLIVRICRLQADRDALLAALRQISEYDGESNSHDPRTVMAREAISRSESH